MGRVPRSLASLYFITLLHWIGNGLVSGGYDTEQRNTEQRNADQLSR